MSETQTAPSSPVSTYRGSVRTREKVAQQIRERWGDEAAEAYSPYTSAMTMRAWNSAGYRVKKGERALRSITIVEVKDDKGTVIRTYPKTVALFHSNQVERVATHNS